MKKSAPCTKLEIFSGNYINFTPDCWEPAAIQPESSALAVAKVKTIFFYLIENMVDRVIFPSVHYVNGFQGSHGQQTVRVK